MKAIAISMALSLIFLFEEGSKTLDKNC